MIRNLAAVLCTVLSGAFFYLSMGIGEIWYLAWIAALPILWLAYGNERPGRVFAAGFVAAAIGQVNMLIAYWGELPVPTLIIIMLLPPASFGVAVLFARLAANRLTPLLAAFAFPALWTGWEYLVSATSPDGTAGAFAYSQAGVPQMVQLASVFGLYVITFLLALNSSLLAMALRQKGRTSRVLAGLALVIFGANVLFGIFRISDTAGEKLRVAMVDSDALNASAFSSDGVTALTTVHAYITAAQGAIKNGARVVVMPEKLAVIEPAWRFDTFAALQQAADTAKVTLIAGFDFRSETRRNVAMVFRPNMPMFEYDKRRMVPGLEGAFQPGINSGLYAQGRATAICKDMDFAGMLRDDAQAGIRVMFVPAWDFGRDGWAHARMAIMRGVEGGYAVVRAARLGFLTASDEYGRVIGGAPTSRTGFVSSVVDVPLGSGNTLYLHIGDVFAWICAVLAIVILVMSLLFERVEVEVPAPKSDTG